MVGSKFSSVFSNSNEQLKIAPKALKKMLNLDAPKGYEYKLMAGTSDMYALRPKNSNEENSFIVRIHFPLDFEGMKINNIDELLEAMYRTQKPYKLDQRLQNNPPTIVHLTGSGITNQIIGVLEKFPELNPLDITVGEQTISHLIKRVPYPSLNEIKIVSDEHALFNLDILFNEDTENMKINIKMNYESIVTVDDYFENYELISSFFTEGVTIFNKKLIPDKSQTEQFKKSFKFFEALKKIQDYLCVKFNYPIKVNDDDLYYTKVLYKSFIDKRMISIPNNEKISFTFDKKKISQSEIKMKRKDEIGVVLPKELTLQLFGAEFSFLEYSIYPHMEFNKLIDNNESEFQLVFDLPIDSRHYILASTDLIEDFDMEKTGNKLLSSVDEAVSIESIDF